MIGARRLTWLGLYAAAMAFVESAVVVYLRLHYYPNGFRFPMRMIPEWVGAIEIGREAATLVMLLAVSVLAGEDRWERFVVFCFSFGVWDIFYYIWLWVLLGWPPSLLTWDILFLIPVPWIGPVLAPVIISVALIAGALVLLRMRRRGIPLSFSGWQWAMAIAGGGVVVSSFTLDWRVVLEERMPPPFRWMLFLSGLVLGVAALGFGVVTSRSTAR